MIKDRNMKAHKTCYKCLRNKHISYFYSKENICKECRNKIAKIHKTVKQKIGYCSNKLRICQICNEIQQILELANINGHEYTTNPKDYILLCSKCHYLFDNLKHSRSGFELNKSIYHNNKEINPKK